MPTLAMIALVSWLAGLSAFAGGLIAKTVGTADSEFGQEMVHGVIAFGGGILIAAVAFALIPEGITTLSPLLLAATFCGGGAVFSAVDALVSSREGSHAQLMAMLLDFVPEAMALGALFGGAHGTGMLLALFIGAQNLPEGFNSYRESAIGDDDGKDDGRGPLLPLFAISFLGPAAAVCGYLLLRERDVLTASIMCFAGGGILYLMFQDIAPESKMRRHWTPPLGAVLGFAVGMVGKQVLG